MKLSTTFGGSGCPLEVGSPPLEILDDDKPLLKKWWLGKPSHNEWWLDFQG